MFEELYVNHIETEFKNNGWKTYREVTPDNSNLRVDLIVYHEKIGYIGIEAKSINMRQGGILAKAHKQIQKYRKQTYFNGIKIDLWALGVYYNTPSVDSKNTTEVLMREFFCAYGIGYIIIKGFNEYRRYSVDFGYSQGWAKIPFNLSNEKMDINKIIESQIKKSKGDW